MGQPRIAAKEPSVLTLEAGTYYWCLCGRSRDQPFCDGSHEGTGFEPLEFTVDETKEVALCQCKRTKTPRTATGHTRRSDGLAVHSSDPPPRVEPLEPPWGDGPY